MFAEKTTICGKTALYKIKPLYGNPYRDSFKKWTNYGDFFLIGEWDFDFWLGEYIEAVTA
jgi:hypothetical protein